MLRPVPFLFILTLNSLQAQSIVWISACANQEFCLPSNGCTQGSVFLVETANTNCNLSSLLNYSYRIDINNDGGTDINSSLDTVSGNFPKGTHKISWRASDNCGQVASCTYLFTIKDCNPPSMLCINGLTQGLDPVNCEATFEAADFVQSIADNCTAAAQIELGVRKTGSGSGFPPTGSVTFGKCEAGTNLVEVWARDANGLTTSCNNYIIVQPNAGGCYCDPFADWRIPVCIRTAGNKKMPNAVVAAKLQSIGTTTPVVQKTRLSAVPDSCLTLHFDELPFNRSYEAVVRAGQPSGYNDPLNGVSTFDLLQISRHILDIQPLQNFYQILAADVNKSQTITTFDIVEIRKLILGIYDTLPNLPSWTVVRPVPNPGNLLSFPVLKDTYNLQLLQVGADTLWPALPFVAVKHGDVNQNASFSAEDTGDRAPVLPLLIDRVMMEAGKSYWLSVGSAEDLEGLGFQLELRVDLTKAALLGMEGVDPANWHLSADGRLRISVVGPVRLVGGTPLFRIHLRAHAPLVTEEAIQMGTAMESEWYVPGDLRHPLALLPVFPPAGSRSRCFLPSPNPFSHATRFELWLAGAGRVVLEVVDVMGRQVYREEQWMEAGSQLLTYPAEGVVGGGPLFYRIQLDDQWFTGKLIRE
jgi:hypothetical protein